MEAGEGGSLAVTKTSQIAVSRVVPNVSTKARPTFDEVPKNCSEAENSPVTTKFWETSMRKFKLRKSSKASFHLPLEGLTVADSN